MPAKLMAARYPEFSTFGIATAETISDVSELGIGWNIPGGIQRIELTVRARSRLDAYARHKDHLGHRIALFDTTCHRYICGEVFEVVPNGSHVTYVCAGPWKRAYDDFYETGDYPGTGDTDVIIKDILTDSMSYDSTDQSNIDASSISAVGWTPELMIGSWPGDAIKELTLIGDSNDKIMDFYFVDQAFSGTQAQAPLPYLKSRSLTASPDWVFSVEDLAQGGRQLGRHIWDLKSDVYIGYGRLAGTHDGGNGSHTLIDGSEDFITDGVRPGDRVVNITDDTVYEVAEVTNLTTLTFTNNTSAAWDNDDVFSINLREPKWTAVNSPATTDYWSRVYKEVYMEMEQTQAEQYRDQLYTTYKDAVLQQAYIVSAPTIKDYNGVRHPLWRVFMGDSYYFRADNLFVDEAVFTDSDDRTNSFMAVSMDYTYSDNRLRVVPSTNDSRLDAMLAQAGIINGRIISTASGVLLPGFPITGTQGGGGGGASGGGGGFPAGGGAPPPGGGGSSGGGSGPGWPGNPSGGGWGFPT